MGGTAKFLATAAAFWLALWLAEAARAQPPEPPEGLVWMALRDTNATWFDPDDPTNRPPLTTTVPEGMIRAVDVSPDGVADWLIDYEKAGLSQYCGTGGCLKRLYVSGDAGFTRAFDAQALGLEVRQGDAGVQVEAWVHHLYCVPDNRDCRYVYVWDVGAGRLELVTTTSEREPGESAFMPLAPHD